MHHIIIGDGPAGEKAAEIIRREQPNDAITLITEEPYPFYLRPGLMNYLAGEFNDHPFCVKEIARYRERNIDLRLNTRVTRINPESQEVSVVSSHDARAEQQLHYDRLLIAAGASYFIPPQLIPVQQYLQMVYTLDDANRLLAASKTAKSAIVMGGSLLGVELVRALYQLGLQVIYLTRKETFWPRTLFHTQAEQVAALLRQHGIELIFGEDIRELLIQSDKVIGIITTKRRELPCDLVGIATDLVPNVGFLKNSGLKIFRGVVVDPHMRTNIPNVYAAGDIAQVYYTKTRMHQVHYSWINATEEGEIAGWNMAGISRTIREEYANDEFEMYGMNIFSRWTHAKQ
ncbi:MAG: FAD-dependent oxidoreductase [bacterium]|nr:FAD-dependent oxidoreductase [bacterium]